MPRWHEQSAMSWLDGWSVAVKRALVFALCLLVHNCQLHASDQLIGQESETSCIWSQIRTMGPPALSERIRPSCPDSSDEGDSSRPGTRDRPLVADQPGEQWLRISGIYPHLAVFNQPAGPKLRRSHLECGIGAVVPWAGKLWYITYPPHMTAGSNDKLYELYAQLNVVIRPESVGGTHACRLIHRESGQLIIGPYFVDRRGRVRAVDLRSLRGRMTAVMRHLSNPAHKVYYFDMEGAIYEVDVRTLAVRLLFKKPVAGWHGKGGCTGQGRVVIANNGEWGPKDGYKHVLAGGPARGDEAGALAEWDGRTWRIVERKQFCEVTGPGGIYGNYSDTDPIWATGWDKRSVILKLLDHGRWYTFRLPKGSYTYDGRHGWYTEWPRIRAIGPNEALMLMHGTMFRFPLRFRAADSSGLQPLCTYLRVVPDFCSWRGQLVLASDDASMMGNPLCGQAQSNLWFGTVQELAAFGPRLGWGGLWLNDRVEAGVPSEPFLIAGYEYRTLHLALDSPSPVSFRIEVDISGKGKWSKLSEILVPGGAYQFLVLGPEVKAQWLRLTAKKSCRATAYLHCFSPRREGGFDTQMFQGLKSAKDHKSWVGGLLRPAEHNRALQWVAMVYDKHEVLTDKLYMEVSLVGNRLCFDREAEDRTEEVELACKLRRGYEIDAASVVVKDESGNIFRLPKAHEFAAAAKGLHHLRMVRECVSERFLANIAGTFYEVPRGEDGTSPDWKRMKPVCSHDKVIQDYCTWRGLLVLSGTAVGASADGHFFLDKAGRGLWFGAIDDLWRLGKPVGVGGPLYQTPVKPGKPSDPYLMTGYDRKTMTLSHDADTTVQFQLELDFDNRGYRTFKRLAVPPGRTVTYRFPDGFQAHWIRVRANKECRATVQLTYA